MATEITPGRYFITGGAGFIGSHVAERLLSASCEVTMYDNLSLSTRAWIDGMSGTAGLTFVEADIRDLGALNRAMAGHDVVFHLAANTDIPRGHADFRIDLENCTIGTNNVLEAMKTQGVRRLLFASSGCVYGEHPVQPLREDAGPLQPISLYGAAKLACEAMIGAYCHLNNMQAWIFRFGNVVGDRMTHGVIYDFIQKLIKDRNELYILGDGTQEKNYLLVEDCIDGMLFASRNTNAPSDVFNLGNSGTTTVRRVADIITDVVGLRGISYRFSGGPRGWPGDQPKIYYDVGKMRRLGWVASHASDEAVRISATRLCARYWPSVELSPIEPVRKAS